jgi:hypothetical protein
VWAAAARVFTTVLTMADGNSNTHEVTAAAPTKENRR